MSPKLISIVIPLHNEADNLKPLVKDIKAALKEVHNFEILFIDDGSTDESKKILRTLTKNNSNIKFLELTRNFGKEIAVTAGLHHVEGDAAIIMDADLQHPANLLPQFVSKWLKGAEVVIGIRNGRDHDGFFRNLTSSIFNASMKRFGDNETIPHATDYRLLDRKVVNEFNRFTERNRLTRGLIDWLGFNCSFIEFTAAPRLRGRSYPKMKLLHLAINSFISHSLLPLRLAGYLGILIILISGPLGLFIFIEQYILRDPWNLHFSGPAILAVILMFMVGVILICLGLISLYIANIHAEVINRPLYVIRKRMK